MSIHSLTKRTAFRIAVLFTGLFGIAVVAIFSMLYLVISDNLNERIKTHVDVIRSTLVDLDRSGTFEDLAKLVASYASDTESEEDIFLLTDSSNGYVAGNILHIPTFVGWRTIPWQKLPLVGTWNTKSGSTAVVGGWVDVKGGHLFVAGGNSDVNAVQHVLVEALGLGLLMAAIFALVGGTVLGLRTQAQIGGIETALDAVARGELSSRVPRTSSGDDLDHVAVLINKTLDRVQSLIASLKQVTSDIAHDLKSPIGRVLQKLELVSDASGDVESYRTTVDAARTDLRDAVATFEALLRIAEIEGGARKSRFTAVDLKPLLANVVEILETVAEDAGHQITANLTTATPTLVRGDKELLTQLFINLIENAIRHCPAGTPIRVELTVDDNHPAVRVADNGPGIPASEYDKVFRRLYRLDKSRTTPGSGLGLSLVAAIAELHDASIALSDNNPGFVVTVRFGTG